MAIDPLTVAGQILNVASIIRKALALIQAMKAAPGEFETTVRHVHSMTILLENVQSDLLNNPRSVINRQHNLRTSRRGELARLVSNCDKSLDQVKALVKKYQSISTSLWRQWRWQDAGKPEADRIHMELMWWAQLMTAFMAREGLNVQARIEIAIEDLQAGQQALMRLMQQIAAGNYKTVLREPKPKKTGGKKPKTTTTGKDSIGRTILASLFICRLRARVQKKKQSRKSKRKPTRPPIIRTNSTPLKRRTTLLGDYVDTIASNPELTKRHRNLECWLIREGQYAFGGRALHAGKQIVRGQAQLAEMATTFQSAGSCSSSTSIDRKHPAVKWIVRQRKGWTMVAARIQSVDASAHGLTNTKKILVILKKE
jgi:hypothetical protein